MISLYFGIIILLFLIVIFILISCMKSNNYSTKKWKLKKLSSKGQLPVDNHINHYRPYNKNDKLNYLGIFNINDNHDYVLNVTSNDYYEVCVYKYPSWDIKYSETNIKNLHLGFLENGNYVCIVHSLGKINGYLENISKEHKIVPSSTTHINGTSSLYDKVDIVYEHICKLMKKRNLNPIDIDYSSITIDKWPKMVYTKIESLKINSDCNTLVIICTDIYPIKIECEGQIIDIKMEKHENNLCSYTLSGNKEYEITQIHTNISENSVCLPFYVYSFN